MYDPNDEAYLAKLSGSPLSVPDDQFAKNFQDYLASQQALPRADRTVEFDPVYLDQSENPVAPAPVVTPAVKKAAKKLQKAISTADAHDLGAVPATVPIPARNAQGVVLPPAIAGSAAGLMAQGKTGMTYPSWSSMVPDFIKSIFRSSVDENTNKARNNQWGSLAGFSPENKTGPLSNRSRIPLP
jgi:hypothetical protein